MHLITDELNELMVVVVEMVEMVELLFLQLEIHLLFHDEHSERDELEFDFELLELLVLLEFLVLLLTISICTKYLEKMYLCES